MNDKEFLSKIVSKTDFIQDELEYLIRYNQMDTSMDRTYCGHWVEQKIIGWDMNIYQFDRDDIYRIIISISDRFFLIVKHVYNLNNKIVYKQPKEVFKKKIISEVWYF